jgi:hypothetical protein
MKLKCSTFGLNNSKRKHFCNNSNEINYKNNETGQQIVFNIIYINAGTNLIVESSEVAFHEEKEV